MSILIDQLTSSVEIEREHDPNASQTQPNAAPAAAPSGSARAATRRVLRELERTRSEDFDD